MAQKEEKLPSSSSATIKECVYFKPRQDKPNENPIYEDYKQKTERKKIEHSNMMWLKR